MSKKEIAVGVDIGATNTAFGFVDRNGKILAEGKLKTFDYGKIDDFVEALYKKTEAISQKISGEYELAGYGIGAPMGNINKGTIEQAANLPWKGVVSFTDLFHKYTTLPVILTNDANTAAVGEMVYGGAKGMKNFIVITLGTGLGSGFVVDGRLMYGHDGFAGELGHISIRPGDTGRECGCGKIGCLETYVSATGLKRTLLKVMADSNRPSELRKISFEDLTAERIYEAAKAGDEIAKRSFERTGKLLGFKLADIVAHTNPEAIFLFGGLALAGDLIFEPARKAMEENLLSIYRNKIKILPSELSMQNAAVLGASSLVWSERNRIS